MKPLTTLGDALSAKGADWRAQLRAEGVERRPPPSRPDRGYVEQPEERINTTVLPPRTPPHQRRRVETPTLHAPVALIRLERPGNSAPPPEPPSPPEPIYYVPPPAELLPPEPATQAPPPDTEQPTPQLGEADMAPRKKRKTRTWTDPDTQRESVSRIIHQGVSHKTIAREIGVSVSAVGKWVKTYGARVKRSGPVSSERAFEAPAAQRTLPSVAPRASGADPKAPELVVRFEGLEAYIRAVVAQELKRRLSD